MTRQMKRPVALLLSLVMAASLFFGMNMPAQAANVDYVYAENYVLNWGERGEDATFLSPMAEDFYEENNTSYEELSSYEGSADVNNVPSSALFAELYELIEENHTHLTTYDETRDLYQYTDCQNSGEVSAAISCFYSGKVIGPAWDSGNTWNREHVWPQSKSPDAENADDIMMLRPTAKSENSSRGNNAYGESDGYFHPNSFAGDRHDIRGDVARILLYQYVRWGNAEMMWGENGVIENEDVLLDWMEADPVDTWEMGRNDAVESITGTRNVFVDYPELSFILFDEEVPVNYTTPSGNAPEEVVGMPKTVMFSQLGVVVSAQSVYEGKSITLPKHTGDVKDGYTFLGWTDTKIEESTTAPTIYKEGAKYTVEADRTFYAVYSREGQGGGSSDSKVFEAYSGELTEGDYLIVYDGGALKAGISSNRFTYQDITVTGNAVNDPDAAIIWTAAKDGENWTIYNQSTSQYAAGSGAKNQGKLLTSVTDYARWRVTGDATYEFENIGNETKGVNFTLRKNGTYGFATYAKSTGGLLSLYKRSDKAIYFFVEDGSATVNDTVAPVISGVVNGKTYCTTQNVTVSDDNLVAVSVNTKPVENTFALEANKETPYIIIAVDKGGNTTTVQVMMRPIANLADSIKDITLDNVKASDKDAIEAVITDVEAFLEDTSLSDADKAKLQEIKTNAEALLQQIEDNKQEVDTVPPVISGVEEGKTYYTSQLITVTDINAVTVTVNGETVNHTFTLAGNKDATYAIVAKDEAGNSTTVTVTMKSIASVADSIKDITVDNVKITDEEAIQAVLDAAEAIPVDNNTTDEEKAAIQAVKENVEALLVQIEEIKNPSLYYEKVTAKRDNWSGRYLIVSEEFDKILNGGKTESDFSKNHSVEFDITSDSINQKDVEGVEFTFIKKDGGYAIKSTSGFYIGVTKDSNTLQASTTDDFVNEIIFNADGSIDIKAIDVKGNTRFLRYNKTSDYFRFYKSGQAAIALYRLNDGIDYAEPVIAGVENGKTYYTSQKITLTDESAVTVTVNGEAVNGTTFTLAGNVDKEYTIVAKDVAGNTTTVTVIMKSIASVADSIKDITVDNVKESDAVAIQAVITAANTIPVDNNTTDAEKEAIQAVIENANKLLQTIEENKDIVNPTITGVVDGKLYYTTQKVTVTDGSPVTVTVNGETVNETTFTLAGNVDKEYTIVATDEAGNTTTVTVTMKSIAGVATSINGITTDNVKETDATAIQAVLDAVEAIPVDDNTTDEEKAAIEAVKENAEALLKKIEDNKKPVDPPTGGEDDDDKDPVVPPTGDNDDKDPVVPPIEDKNDYEAELDNEADVESKIEFTEEEQVEIENGAEVEVKLEFKEIGTTATTEEQKEIEKELGNKKIGTFLEIGLVKVVGTNETTITETKGLITITFVLPAELKNTNEKVSRTYSVLRYHDGEVAVLDATYDPETGKIAFQTDKFSTYAVAYEDVEVVIPPVVPGTGDGNINVLWYMMLLVGGVALILLGLDEHKIKLFVK